MKTKIFGIMAAALTAGAAGGCDALGNVKSCGFAYNAANGMIMEDLENVAFVDKDEEIALSFDYEGVTYSMDFPPENYQESYGYKIYYYTFSNSEGRECLVNLIITDETYGAATGTVRFTEHMGGNEEFGFVVAPNKSALEDFRTAMEEGIVQVDTRSSSAEQTEIK